MVGAVIGSVWLATQGRDRATPIRGPYLAIAGWIVFFWGPQIIDAYLRFAGLEFDPRLPAGMIAGMSDYFIGLTGGIASGKSALEKAFAKQGVVADADLLAREVVAPGEPALAAVVERFERVLPDGWPARPRGAAVWRIRRPGPAARTGGHPAPGHPRTAGGDLPGPPRGPMPSPRSRCSPRAAAAQRIRGCTASWWWTLPLPCRRRG